MAKEITWKEIDKARLAKVTEVIEALDMKFPVAEISRLTGKNEGNVSRYITGKAPMSKPFFTSFMQKVAPKKTDFIVKPEDYGNVISNLLEISIKQQAQINLLLKAFDKISGAAVQKEYSRLHDEYLQQQNPEQ